MVYMAHFYIDLNIYDMKICLPHHSQRKHNGSTWKLDTWKLDKNKILHLN